MKNKLICLLLVLCTVLLAACSTSPEPTTTTPAATTTTPATTTTTPAGTTTTTPLSPAPPVQPPQDPQKLTITGVTLSDSWVEYDGRPHSIQVVGNVPSGVICTYTYNGESKTSVTETGTYVVRATLSGDGYNTLILQATLTIFAPELALSTTVFNGKVYFQNPLHDNLLYSYSSTGLKQISKDEASNFTVCGNSIYYTSKGLFKSTIKVMNTSEIVKTFTGEAGEYLTNDGTYLYYAVNNLIDPNGKNGIYRLAFDHEEDTAPTKIYSGKASYLVVYNGYVYFAAGAEKGKLSRVLASGGTATTLSEDDISDIVLNGSKLYYNVHTLTGNAIHNYNLSNGQQTKMTTDSGKNLTIIGSYLYYINKDLATATLFGDGICRVALTASGSMPGEKIVDAQVMSLTSDGNYLYYYLRSNKHLHRFNINTKQVNDLMASFQPIDNTVVSGYAYAKEYNGEIYYLNARDDGAIYKYNPQTRQNFKVIPDSCSAFYFDGNYLYYSSYILTNYDLYRVPVGGGDAEKISSSRCDLLIFSGEYIYYVDNGVTYNTLRRMKPNSTQEDKESTVLYGSLNASVEFLSLELVNGKIYFCTNPRIGAKKLYAYDIAASTTTQIHDGEQFVTNGSVIFFYDDGEKEILAYNINTTTATTIAQNVSDLRSMVLHAGKLYYAGKESSATGMWSINLDGTGKVKIFTDACCGLTSTTQGLVYYKMSITMVDERPATNAGDGNLFLYNGITSSKIS